MIERELTKKELQLIYDSSEERFITERIEKNSIKIFWTHPRDIKKGDTIILHGIAKTSRGEYDSFNLAIDGYSAYNSIIGDFMMPVIYYKTCRKGKEIGYFKQP